MAYGLERNEVEDSEEYTADSSEQNGAWGNKRRIVRRLRRAVRFQRKPGV